MPVHSQLLLANDMKSYLMPALSINLNQVQVGQGLLILFLFSKCVDLDDITMEAHVMTAPRERTVPNLVSIRPAPAALPVFPTPTLKAQEQPRVVTAVSINSFPWFITSNYGKQV